MKTKKNKKQNQTNVIESKDFDLNTDEGITAFLLNYISKYNVTYSYVHSYGGYPGGRSENYFNEGDVRGTLNYAVVNTLKFFKSDTSKERNVKTVIGAFKKIAKNEMIDVYNKNYDTEKRTIIIGEKQYTPTFTNSDDQKLISNNSSDSEILCQNELMQKLRRAISNLDPIEQQIINLKLYGNKDQDIAEALNKTKREVMTILIRVKRKIRNDRELEVLCA